MLFNTFEFIFFFLTTVVLYYFSPHKFRWALLLVLSYYFYYSWEPKLTILLFASTTIDYLCGIKINDCKKPTWRKAYLIVSICTNLGLLIFFKYLGFFTETTLQIVQFFGIELPNVEQFNSPQRYVQILLPIGISFYTFQTLSYSIEIYRGHIQPERHFGRYALFVSFFPQLVAGPIERAQNFLPQLKNKIVFNAKSVRIGLMLMAWGYFMKMVVADRLGIFVDIAFHNPSKYSGIPLIIGAYFFTFQIYFDFAAYSIIAIGAARILGFKLMTNFDRPIFSRTIGEFWTRWHISLMSWLKDYLYRPLVMNAKMKRYMALLIVFVLSGLWHGASWNFVIWGGMSGLILLVEIITGKARERIVTRLAPFISPSFLHFIRWVVGFNFIVFSLIFFRAPTVPAALNYIKNMVNISSLRISVLNEPFELVLSFVFIIIVQVVHYFKPDHKVFELIDNKNVIIRWSIYLLFIFVIVFFSAVRNDPFIYFQF